MGMEIGSSQSAWSTSVQGYQRAESSLDQHAKGLANWSADAATDKPTTTDPTSDMVGMATDKLVGSYNLKALKVQNQMAGELMDLIG
jgi:hypothetical protein